MINNYEDIINEKRPQSTNHKPMSLNDRASQFSPFKALTGYEKTIFETARLTEEKKILTDDAREIINLNLNEIKNSLSSNPNVEIIYFSKDKTKNGGKYIHLLTKIKSFDEVYHKIILMDKKTINIDDIYEINLKK